MRHAIGPVALAPGEAVFIGRSVECTIHLAVDGLAGHRHCRIRVDADGTARLSAGGHSTTSPRWNGAFVTGEVTLAIGDRIDVLTEAERLVASFVVAPADTSR